MQPTIKDVARQAGVSTATVSRVLNDAEGVSEHTKIRVEQAIIDLDYRYNAMARSLKKRQSNLIGHIVPSILGPVSPTLARAVEEQANASGFNVILCNSFENSGKERKNIDVMLERRVDGVVFTSPMIMEHAHIMKARGIPLAIIERRSEIPDFHFVESNNFNGSYTAVKHLLSLGHRRIAMVVCHQSGVIISKLRMEGYERALLDAQIGVDPNLIIQGDYSRQSGYQAMKKLVSMNPRPTAIFATNDTMAIGAMQAANDVGLQIPKDISIIGFDDTYAELAIPPLTTIHQPLNEIGKLATQIVIANINGKTKDYPLENIIECHLKERSSCGPPSA